MLINFWDCEFSDAENENIGTDEEVDYEWKYYCSHSRNRTGICELGNKWPGDEGNCMFLDEQNNQ